MIDNGLAAPASIESEEAALGSILLDPATFYDVAMVLTDVTDFYLLRHQVIWSAMQRLKQRKDEVDHITVAAELDASGDLQKIGGRSYLIELINKTGTAMYVEVYARMVSRTAIRRRLLAAADEIKRLAYDETLEIEEVEGQADEQLLSVTAAAKTSRTAYMSDVVSDMYDDVTRRMAQDDKAIGISTHLRDLNNLMYGFEKDTLTIVAGRPGMGKSAIMDGFALHVAGTLGIPVFYATSERSHDQVVKRMTSIISGIPTGRLKSGQLSPQEAARFTEVVGELDKYPIIFLDSPEPSPREIFSQARWAIQRHGVQLILFDGMYRSKTGIKDIDNGSNNNIRYGRIALQLKTMSRELHIPVVVTHQLSRAVEQRQNKRPIMSDLRESGNIEQEADKILFLYRDSEYNPKTEFPNQCELILAKHREGSTGICSVYFEARNVRFSDASVHRVGLSDLESNGAVKMPYSD